MLEIHSNVVRIDKGEKDDIELSQLKFLISVIFLNIEYLIVQYLTLLWRGMNIHEWEHLMNKLEGGDAGVE